MHCRDSKFLHFDFASLRNIQKQRRLNEFSARKCHKSRVFLVLFGSRKKNLLYFIKKLFLIIYKKILLYFIIKVGRFLKIFCHHFFQKICYLKF